MFKEAATYNNHTDLQEYTETVTAYIKKCMDDVTVTKTITTRANQKPWMTAEVRGLLKTRDEAFRLGLHDIGKKLTLRYFVFLQYTVGTESIQTPLHFSLFVILQPFAKII